jgi:hypothetical protein
MSKRALLLNSNYEILSFISERKVCKFLYKEKADPISFWEDTIPWGKEEIHLPSVLVLKSEIKYRVSRIHFSRKLLIKRDKNQCQYCGVKIYGAQITMDHILPKSRGGKTSFLNCVLACHDCNNSKNDDTPEEAGMKLLSNPINPIFTSKFYVSEDQEFWHESWNSFFTH